MKALCCKLFRTRVRLPPPPPLLSCLFFSSLANSDEKTQAKLYSCAPEFAPIWRFEQNFAEVGVLMLSVYTRHHPDCKNAGDKTWRRCSCPKWIWGSLNGKFIRQSARTPRWEEAEELRQLSEGLLPASRPAAKPDLAVDAPVPRREGSNSERPQKPRVTVETAVEAYWPMQRAAASRLPRRPN